MNSVPCFVGLDYHQDFVQVCVLDPHGKQRLNRRCPNDWRAIVQAVAGLGPIQGAAIEACGGAANLAQELRDQAHWPIDLAHAGYVAKLKQSPDKSDYQDGRLLADLGRVGYLPKVWLASDYERDLRLLLQHRQDLVDQRRDVKLRAGALLREQRAFPPEGLGARGARPSRWSRAWVAWARSAPELTENGRWILGRLLDRIEPLDQEIREVEQRLHQATAADAKVAALLAEPGIGPVTAWVLRAFVGRFDRFAHGKQLSRYCGLSPANASSGAVQADAGLVRGCNKLLRAILIQAAHRLIRTVPRWRDLAAAMARRGKKKCLVVAAVANRWMRGLWHRHLETRRPRAARPA